MSWPDLCEKLLTLLEAAGADTSEEQTHRAPQRLSLIHI